MCKYSTLCPAYNKRDKKCIPFLLGAYYYEKRTSWEEIKKVYET